MTPTPPALALARRLTALPEPAMRERVLLEYLLAEDPDRAVAVLAEIHAFGVHGGPPFNLALLALAGVLASDLLAYEPRARLYSAAKEAGLSNLLDLFLSNRNQPGGVMEGAAPDRELTLGHRKSMARSHNRDTLQALLRDPEPEVIPILLRNPRLIERDVVALASRRPTAGELQWCVFSSRRWISRYAVKRTLVLNPYTPTDLGLRLLAFLNAADLRLVEGSPSLPLPIRRAASRLLASAVDK
jgi:hypothetical protein